MGAYCILLLSGIPWCMMWCLIMIQKLKQIKTRHIVTTRKKPMLVTTCIYHFIIWLDVIHTFPLTHFNHLHLFPPTFILNVHPVPSSSTNYSNNFTAMWLPGCWCYQTWCPNSRSLTHFRLANPPDLRQAKMTMRMECLHQHLYFSWFVKLLRMTYGYVYD